MLKRIIKTVVSDQENRCTNVVTRQGSGNVERQGDIRISDGGGSEWVNNGLLWRPQPKAPPFGRGWFTFHFPRIG
jgi:hypothetical protein